MLAACEGLYEIMREGRNVHITKEDIQLREIFSAYNSQ